MSYRPQMGTFEIDLSSRRPRAPMYSYHRVDTTPTTPAERWVGLGLVAAFLGVFAYAIWKAPKGAWGPSRRYYYDDRPDFRIRLNKRRRKRRKRSRR